MIAKLIIFIFIVLKLKRIHEKESSIKNFVVMADLISPTSRFELSNGEMEFAMMFKSRFANDTINGRPLEHYFRVIFMTSEGIVKDGFYEN